VVGMVGRAERVLGLMLACRKELPLLLRAEAWDPDGKQRGRLLLGARVLIVTAPDGAGTAGLDGAADADALVTLLAPFGADIGRASQVAPVDVATTDVLVLLPGSPPVGADVLAALPEESSVVDACAPGAPAVDLDALATGLDAGRPRHAALLVAGDVAREATGDATGSTVGPEHALWAAPRALLVPIEERAA